MYTRTMTLGTLQDILKDKKFRLVIAILIFIAVLGISSFLATRPTKTPLGTGIEPEIRPTRPGVAVLRVEPLPDQKGISTSPTIKIAFEKSITGKKIAISSSPKFTFSQELSTEGYRLTLTPKSQLKSSTKYTLTILAEKVKIYSWTFTTGKKGADPVVVEKIKDDLPFDGEHFRISYSAATDRFYVTIDAKPVDKYKQAALSWFASEGLPNAEDQLNILFPTTGEAAD